MQNSRRWLAALLLALGLLPGAERALLAHGHEHGGALAIAAAPQGSHGTGAAGDGRLDCAACQARATLDVLTSDAHPERHGASPFTPAPSWTEAEPLAPRGAPPPARAPPARIV